MSLHSTNHFFLTNHLLQVAGDKASKMKLLGFLGYIIAVFKTMRLRECVCGTTLHLYGPSGWCGMFEFPAQMT